MTFSMNGQLNRTWASLGGDPLGMPMEDYLDGIQMGKPILITDLTILWEVCPRLFKIVTRQFALLFPNMGDVSSGSKLLLPQLPTVNDDNLAINFLPEVTFVRMLYLSRCSWVS